MLKLLALAVSATALLSAAAARPEEITVKPQPLGGAGGRVACGVVP